MQLNTIDKADARGKRVLLRVDFNVSTFAGKITDDFRIKRALPTIEYLLENEAKVIIASHFGRPPENGINDIKEREKFSMRPIAERLAQDLRYPVKFVSECVGEEAEKAVERMKTGDILVFHAKGIDIGQSQIGKNIAVDTGDLNWTSPNLHLPVDVIVADEISKNALTKKVGVGKVGDNEIILDIGPDTVELFSEVIKSAGTIIWNGPLGFSELPNFAEGTAAFAKAVAKSNAFKIVGGGDSITVIDKLGLSDRIDFISTGGGAMLEFLSGEPMPGIEALVHKT